MLNSVVLVGRLAEELEIMEDKANIVLAVPRYFKNADGEYDTDFIKVELWNAVATNTKEYCHKGDVLGIKGRIEISQENGMKIVADKVTFLSSSPKKSEEEKETSN